MRASTRKTVALLVSCALAASLTRGAPAFAEEAAERDQAAALFKEGNAAFGDKRWADAEKAYEQAWGLGPSFDVAGNYGEVCIHLSKYALAAALLSFNLRSAPPSTKAEQLERTRYFLEEARKHVGSVRARIDVAGAKLVVDGRAVSADDAAFPIFLAPGSHTIEARLPGYVTASEVVDVTAGVESLVQLSLHRSRAPLVAAGAVAAVAVAAGVGFYLAGSSKGSDADAQLTDLQKERGTDVVCPTEGATGTCAEIRSLRNERDTFLDVGTGAFIAAGVALAAGATYALWPSPTPKASARLELVPVLGAGTSGAWLRGAF